MLELTKRYPQKRAFITGAGSGLGAALSLRLAADGWTVAMCDIRPDPLATSAQAVSGAGGRPLTWTLDVTDREAFAKVAEDAIGKMGGVDLVVNNAGVAASGLVGEFPLEDWEWLLRTNLLGPVYGCHFFVPQLRRQRAGHLINISSAAALAPVPTMAAYCTAKAGVKMLSEVVLNEATRDGVDVTVVMPEFFRTQLHQGMRGKEEDRERARGLIERSRYSADDVAKVVIEEAGRRQLYVTFPRRTRTLWFLMRLSPGFANRMIRFTERRMGRRRT